jgi:hypothetical protein
MVRLNQRADFLLSPRRNTKRICPGLRAHQHAEQLPVERCLRPASILDVDNHELQQHVQTDHD